MAHYLSQYVLDVKLLVPLFIKKYANSLTKMCFTASKKLYKANALKISIVQLFKAFSYSVKRCEKVERKTE